MVTKLLAHRSKNTFLGRNKNASLGATSFPHSPIACCSSSSNATLLSSSSLSLSLSSCINAVHSATTPYVSVRQQYRFARTNNNSNSNNNSNANGGAFNPYKILGVNPQTPPKDVKRAYQRLALKYHPDNTETGNIDKFRAVQEAYTCIKDGKVWNEATSGWGGGGDGGSGGDAANNSNGGGNGGRGRNGFYTYEEPGSTTENYFADNQRMATFVKLVLLWCFCFLAIRIIMFQIFPLKGQAPPMVTPEELAQMQQQQQQQTQNVATTSPTTSQQLGQQDSTAQQQQQQGRGGGGGFQHAAPLYGSTTSDDSSASATTVKRGGYGYDGVISGNMPSANVVDFTSSSSSSSSPPFSSSSTFASSADGMMGSSTLYDPLRTENANLQADPLHPTASPTATASQQQQTASSILSGITKIWKF